MHYDIAIIGAGPAGSVCAAICAAGGARTLLLERAVFPRDKVCGDCLNPAAWPVLERLGVAEAVAALPHAALREVAFVGGDERPIRHPLPTGARGEIGIRRSLLDELLLRAAAERGAEVQHAAAERIVRTPSGWQITAGTHIFHATTLVAADGRNSTVARLLGLLPSAVRDRVALQTHFADAANIGGTVEMRFLPWGYSGLAGIGAGLLNLCLVARPQHLAALRGWACAHFALPAEQPWRSVTPLTRGTISPVHDGLLLIGDAAHVVEPFTGEGIYYALATGELAARHLLARDLPGYMRAQRQLYAGRLWINHLARAACLYPRFAAAILCTARAFPALLGVLTRKVTS